MYYISRKKGNVFMSVVCFYEPSRAYIDPEFPVSPAGRDPERPRPGGIPGKAGPGPRPRKMDGCGAHHRVWPRCADLF